MAENNEYKIIIEIPPQAEDGQSTTAPTSNGKTNETESAKDKQSSGKKAALKTIAAVGTAVSLIDRVSSQYVNTTTLRTGFENQQLKYQMIQNQVKSGIGLVSSVAGGFMVGNVPGAVIGAVVSVTGTMIDVGIKTNTVQIQRGVESTQSFLNQIRMGAGSNRGNRE
jgi:hypothetical protein